MDRFPAARLRRLLPLDSRGGWVLAAGLAGWLLLASRSNWISIGSGADYWLFLGVVLAALAAAFAALRLLRGRTWRPNPVEAMAVMAVSAMVVTDLGMAYQPLRDLAVYIKAGHHFIAGLPVYMHTALTARPEDLTNYPFLYPPLTLPVFGALAQLPPAVAQAVWVAGSVALVLLAFRTFGIERRWLPFLILWPPLFQGLWVGNVAVPALAILALAPRFGAGLILGAVFKSYTGIAALWLVRERRWRGVALGVAATLLLAAITLPLVGTHLWNEWIDGLRTYQTSQQNVPSLYGFGLLKFIPVWAFLALAAAAIVAALRTSGPQSERESLARFGVATIVASPSLWGHGLLAAVPSMLTLRAPWLWLAIGITSTPDGLQWWLAVALLAVSWAMPELGRRSLKASQIDRETLHPLGAEIEPWPDATTDQLAHRRIGV